MKHVQATFLTGYVTIAVKGSMPEKFLQLCVDHKIPVWNVRKVDPKTCEGNIRLRDIGEMRKLRRDTGYKIVFSHKKGLPFILGRFLGRKEWVASALLSAFLILVLSNILWKVEISGVPVDIEKKIVKELDNYGIHPGTWTFSMESPSEIQQNLLRDIPELLWVGVEKMGTTFRLEGVEKIVVKKEPVTGPRNLVANKKGIIKKMYVSKGRPLVYINDFVEPGDVLVSGNLLENTDNNKDEKKKGKKPVLVSAEGEVIAKTWYEVDVTVPLKGSKEELTGQQERKYYLQLADFRLPVWHFGSPDFKKMQVDNDKKPLYFLKWKLPVSLVESVLNEKRSKHVSYTREEAMKIGLTQAKHQLQIQLPEDAKIISEKVLHESIDHGKVKLTIYMTVEENIAEAKAINGKNE